MKVTHNFRESLALSHSYADEPWWLDVYRQAFPNLIGCHDMRDASWAQRAGIDRTIVLDSSKTLTVDEKVRTVNWPDVLLEYWSNYQRRERGWVAKELSCDFIAYAFVPSRTCLLLPFPVLRRAWRINHLDWVKKYPKIEANNGSYTTISVAVPTPVLRDAVSDAMVIVWAAP